LLYSRLS